jgi:hypothetical protein
MLDAIFFPSQPWSRSQAPAELGRRINPIECLSDHHKPIIAQTLHRPSANPAPNIKVLFNAFATLTFDFRNLPVQFFFLILSFLHFLTVPIPNMKLEDEPNRTLCSTHILHLNLALLRWSLTTKLTLFPVPVLLSVTYPRLKSHRLSADSGRAVWLNINDFVGSCQALDAKDMSGPIQQLLAHGLLTNLYW